MLTDGQIEDMLEAGELGITMLRTGAIQPCSVDLHLGRELKKQRRTGLAVNLQNPPQFDLMSRIGEGPDTHWLYPGEFYLGHTSESFVIPDHLVGTLHGKSSWGRCGLMVHSTAGHIDPGFVGQITLELRVIGADPIEVKFSDPIAQICFTRLSRPVEAPYGAEQRDSHYQGQIGATEVASRA